MITAAPPARTIDTQQQVRHSDTGNLGRLPPANGHLTLRLTADSFPRLLSISYSTVCPSFSELRPARSTAEMWTNTSLPPPPDGCMKPYPFVGLNHFTVPVGISVSKVG